MSFFTLLAAKMINAFVHGNTVQPGAYRRIAAVSIGFTVNINKYILGYFLCIMYMLNHLQHQVIHPLLMCFNKGPESSRIFPEIQHVQLVDRQFVKYIATYLVEGTIKNLRSEQNNFSEFRAFILFFNKKPVYRPGSVTGNKEVDKPQQANNRNDHLRVGVKDAP